MLSTDQARTVSRRSFSGMMAAATGTVVAAGGLTAPALRYASAAALDEAATADLVVVGSGAAGLAAAAKAAQGGASVIVLEAEKATGGTTKLCGGHWKFINDWFMGALPERTEDSDASIAEVLDWDPADFGDYADAVKTCQDQVTEYLAGDSKLEFDSVEYWLALHQLYTRSTDLDGVEATTDFDVVSDAYYNQGTIADWLAEGGLTWSDPQPNNRGAGGPLSVEPDGQGMGFVTTLEDMATSAGAQIVLNTKVTDLVSTDGRVTGVVAIAEDGSSVTYTANRGVLLACGGFCSNAQMVADTQRLYTGIDATVPSCEPDACDGTMIDAAKKLGATTANMQFVQFFGFPQAQYISIEQMIPLANMAMKLVVNSDGERFGVDRGFWGGGGTEGVEPVCNQPGGKYYVVGDASAKEQVLADSWDTYSEIGTICPGDSVEEAAQAAGLESETLAKTVETFNGYCEAENDPDFGREVTAENAVTQMPCFVAPMAMYGQNTMGGLVINTDGNVLDANGDVIDGLWAAGEICGNMDGGLRRHGDNFAHILWYGYRCGELVSQM